MDFKLWRRKETPEQTGTGEAGARRPAAAPDALGIGSGEPTDRSAERASLRGLHGAETRLAGPAESAAEAEARLGGEAPDPRPPSGGRATLNQVAQGATRSDAGAKPDALGAEGVFRVARPHEVRPWQGSERSDEEGGAEKQKSSAIVGVQPKDPEATRGAQSALRSADSMTRSSIAEGQPSTITSESSKRRKQKSKNAVGEELTDRILLQIHRFGGLTQRAICALVFDHDESVSKGMKANLRKKITKLVDKEFIMLVKEKTTSSTKSEDDVSNFYKPESEPKPEECKGAPLDVYKIRRRGVKRLIARGVVSPYIALTPDFTASDIREPASPRHDELSAIFISELSDEYEYVTGHELKCACSSSFGRIPDLLFRKKGTTYWTAGEVEWSRKTGENFSFMVRFMSRALEDGVMIAGQWHVTNAMSITVDNKKAPTGDRIAASVTKFLTTDQDFDVRTYCVYKGVLVPGSGQTITHTLTPTWDSSAIDFDESHWGDNPIESIGDYVEHCKNNGKRIEYYDTEYKLFCIRSWTFGPYSGTLMCEWNSINPTYYTSLAFDGKVMVPQAPLGYDLSDFLEPRNEIITACRWGTGSGDFEAETAYFLIKDYGRLSMLRHIPELARLVRNSPERFQSNDKA